MLTAAASSLGPGSEQEPEPAARSCVWLLHGRVSQWSAAATPARPLPRHRRRARLRHKRDWRPGRASRRLWHLHLLAGHTNEAATLCRADNETCFPKRHRARSLPPDSATAGASGAAATRKPSEHRASPLDCVPTLRTEEQSEPSPSSPESHEEATRATFIWKHSGAYGTWSGRLARPGAVRTGGREAGVAQGQRAAGKTAPAPGDGGHGTTSPSPSPRGGAGAQCPRCNFIPQDPPPRRDLRLGPRTVSTWPWPLQAQFCGLLNEIPRWLLLLPLYFRVNRKIARPPPPAPMDLWSASGCLHIQDDTHQGPGDPQGETNSQEQGCG